MEQLLAHGGSWSQAQHATVAMKKDRAFVHAGCFICGSTQNVTQGADRLSLHGLSKSKGKRGLHYKEEDWQD